MRLTGTDAMLLYLDGARHYQHTLKIAIIDPSAEPRAASYEASKRLFAQRLHRVPPLRWRYAPTPFGLHHPVWVEDADFDANYHFRRVVCPAPGDQKALCELVSSIYAWPLDHSRPLWVMWIVEGLQGGHVAYVMIVHHAYFDGVAAGRALQEFVRPDEPGEAKAARWDPKPWPSAGRRILWALRDLPGVFLRDVPRAVAGLRKHRAVTAAYRRAGRPMPPTPADAPLTPLNRLLSHGRTFVCDSLPLADFQHVRSALGATINDVFLACSAAAIRRFFVDCGYDPDRGPIVAGIPIGLERPAEKAAVGNFTTYAFLWLPTHLAKPLERLRAASEAATLMKQHLEAAKGSDLGALFDAMPPVAGRLVEAFMRYKRGTFPFFGNVVLSNVQGPKVPIYLGKVRYENWFSIGQILHGTPINMTVWSYHQNMNLCILADSALVKDAWVLFGYFRDALEELVELTGGQRAAAGGVA
jgi:diacylglycerol O-acyltransferase